MAAGSEPGFVVLAGSERIQRGHANGVEAQLERARLEARGRTTLCVVPLGSARQPLLSPGGFAGLAGLGLVPCLGCLWSESGGADLLRVSDGGGAGLMRGGS